MHVSQKILSILRSGVVPVCVILALISIPSVTSAVTCNDPDTVGGGALGLSPGPVGPPDSLGWDVGNGQCNGSFTSTADVGFTGGDLELAMRAEQRSVGQVTRVGANEYVVQTGSDTTQPNAARAWWNFQHSIAYGGDIDDLDSLTFTIQTISGPNNPSAGSFDMLLGRAALDDRNNQPNATSTYADLYQTSQNPEFAPWFGASGAFDYDAEGAWVMTLTATEGLDTASVSICIRTPNAACPPAQVPASSARGIALLGVLFAIALGVLTTRLWKRPRLA